MTNKQLSAGLAIHDNALYYAELDENDSTIRKFAVKLEQGCVINNSVKDFELLEAGFTQLKHLTGDITSVNIGIPSGDVIVRPVTFPQMSMEDVKSALNLNFEEYFPFARDESIFDTARVKLPPSIPKNDDTAILTAALRKSYMEKILTVARNSDFTVNAIEPVNFAMLRRIPEARSGFCLIADTKSIVTVWEGNGIFYRNSDNTQSPRDILNTLQYLRSQYRTISIDKIFLAGIDFQELHENSDIKIFHLQDSFYLAEGLAMRTGSVNSLDLRPVEYVLSEKRRYSFNLTRLLLVGMLSVFVIMSVGSIVRSFHGAKLLNLELELLRGSIRDLSNRRIILMEENSRLERQRINAEKILNFVHDDIPALEILNELEENSESGIKFQMVNFTRDKSGCVVSIEGTANDDKSLVSMTEGLNESGLFESVIISRSQKSRRGSVEFNIILRVKNVIDDG